MVERIKELCLQRGTNIAQLERALGFANGSISKSDQKIQSVRLKAIADYFGVSMEYLLGFQDTAPPLIVSDFEYEIITEYRKLTPDAKALFLRSLGLEVPAERKTAKDA